ncbi:MAG: glycosyltransferase family protein [Calditerrivibrio sp.]|nr:glycosyltransferase family protein [Calditerrivibrio sp.]
MNICAIVQARVSSKRLPGKVLYKLPFGSDITVLQRVIRRTKKSSLINEIIVATTLDDDDYEIVRIAELEKVSYFRGSKEDVLSRYYWAAKKFKADIIVRITSDCPCIDWNIIDRCIKVHIDEGADYTSNCIKRSFPHGLDVEVISFFALETAFEKADKQYEREHVCPYIHTTKKDQFNISHVIAQDGERGADIRLTVDTVEDYALLCAVYDYLFYKNEFFELKDIIKLFDEKPWLKYVNQKVIQKRYFDTLDEELREAVRVLRLQDLEKSAVILEGMIKR